MLFGANSFTDGSSFLILALYASGLMLILSDFSQHKHYLSIFGILLLASGLVGILASERDIYAVFNAVIIAVAIIMGTHLVMLYLTKREWINRYSEKSSDTLIGLEGVTTTEVQGNGHMAIGSTNIFVSSEKSIEKGKKVRIIKIDGDKIFVEEII